MVPYAATQRNRAGTVTALALLLALACSRRIELYDEPDAGSAPVGGVPQPPDQIADIPDSGVSGAERAVCAERPTGQCQGANDFPCDFGGWVERAVDRCQLETDCQANDWVRVALGADGCVAAIGMVEPEAAFVACLADEFGSFGCPQCGAMEATSYLGEGNTGCIVACERDEDCDDGEFCESGYCQRRLG